MRWTLHLPVLLLCALSVAACTSAEEAEDRSREQLVGGNIAVVNEQLPAKVQCPDDIDAEEGARFRCMAKAFDGTSVAVNVVQPQDVSSLKVSTELLETRKVEEFLRRDLNSGRRRQGVVNPLDCQDLVEVKKGGRFTCKGYFACLCGEGYDGNFTVRATFTDDRGMISYTHTVRPS